MKANELRLGNLFYLPNGEVGTISYHEIRLMVVALDKPNYQPIPLTEEWFLKFGFKKVGTNFELDFFVLWYSSYQNCFVWRFMNIDSNADRPISLKYVHQLQNLYFALTGEELTLNQES